MYIVHQFHVNLFDWKYILLNIRDDMKIDIIHDIKRFVIKYMETIYL